MPSVSSVDGTTIGYESSGAGPAVVLVDGAMCHRAGGPMRPLAAALAAEFTVYVYDRRGRGDSGDTLPYAVRREVEDLRAVIDAAGGSAMAYGISSGGALVLTAAASGAPITRLAIYEPPFVAADHPGLASGRYRRELDAALAAGDRGRAVELFMTMVGVPEQAIAGARTGPGWPAMEAIAPTLAYDDTVLGDARVPARQAAGVTVPALLLAGGASPQPLRDAARATAEALPDGGYEVLAGQTHDVEPAALAPVLAAFFRK
jgi:pimeloyl-ACP methyl ester carboxylesterase